ncbi:MAG: GNAT family N-acetyltransferase [Alphaproteobacteria bacterium]|nr:GNAT family N-acetyltransferase [Alphaproteobacteria bacterium]
MTKPALISPEPPSEADLRQLSDGLTAHAREAGHPFGMTDHGFFLRDPDGRMEAGLHAIHAAGHGTYFVRLLWVAPERRGEGLGTRLLASAEAHARALGCSVLYLDTFDFQGPDYYPRFGFEIFGRLDIPGTGLTRLYFVKRLS